MSFDSYVNLDKETTLKYLNLKKEHIQRLHDERIEDFIQSNTRPSKSTFIGTIPEVTRKQATEMLDDYVEDELYHDVTNRQLISIKYKNILAQLTTYEHMLNDAVDAKVLLSYKDYKFLTDY